MNMDFETKKLVAPVFNHFYEKYDVRHHEEIMHRKDWKRSVAIVKGYKEGKKAVLDYIVNGGLPLCLYSKEELMEAFEKAFLSVIEFKTKINTDMKISDNERDILSDTCVYLKYYEDSIVKNNDKSMLPFCADIALKRLFLVDKSPFPFHNGYRDEVLSDIEEHVLSGRCTDNTKAKYELYIKPYLDKKRTESEQKKNIGNMEKKDKDLCLMCEHYWEDFPMPLENVISHCDKVDEKYGFKGMNEYVPYPCLECPFNCYSPKK